MLFYTACVNSILQRKTVVHIPEYWVAAAGMPVANQQFNKGAEKGLYGESEKNVAQIVVVFFLSSELKL